MRNIFIMSHQSDIDGVGSAALIRMKYEVPLSNIFFTDYSKAGLEYVDKNLSTMYKNGITLFIADLGINDSLIPSYKKIVDHVKKHNGSVVWFDHHPWPESAVKEIASKCDIAIVGENDKFCATEITYRELGFRGKFTKDFVKIVHHSDFNIPPKEKGHRDLVGLYALSITNYNTSHSRDMMTKKLRHVVDVISKGEFSDPTIRGDATSFKKLNDSRINLMLKDLITRKNFALGFSKQIQSTAGCGAIMDKSGKEISIYINISDQRGHIRSRTTDISLLASALGGGGHPHASGFNIDSNKFGYLRTRKQKEAFADFLEEKMVAAYRKRY